MTIPNAFACSVALCMAGWIFYRTLKVRSLREARRKQQAWAAYLRERERGGGIR